MVAVFITWLVAIIAVMVAMVRLAMVQSGLRPEPFLETVKKTRLYGLVNWDLLGLPLRWE